MESTVQLELTEDQVNSLQPLVEKLQAAKETGKLGSAVAQIFVDQDGGDMYVVFIEPEMVPHFFKLFGTHEGTPAGKVLEMYYGQKGLIMMEKLLGEGSTVEEAFSQVIETL